MPGRIAALVIEDMDVDINKDEDKKLSDRLAEITDVAARRQFNRQFDSFSALSDSLGQWYDKERIQGWRDDGRVFEKHDGTWWSGVSPLAQVCCVKSTD